MMRGSNNTNKLSPQELPYCIIFLFSGSNNTNKLSPQELTALISAEYCSNNTNKLSPQEPLPLYRKNLTVQIIQINLVLKNRYEPA